MGSNSYNILLINGNNRNKKLLQYQLDKLDLPVKLDILNKGEQVADAITSDSPDLIISDISLSADKLKEAIKLVSNQESDLPFILLTDPEREEQAIDLMMKGASDYIVKDRPDRLRPIIKQKLSYSNTSQKTISSSHFESLVQSIDGIVWEADANTREFYYVSPQSKRILGYSPSEWYEDRSFWKNHIHPKDREKTHRMYMNKTKKGEDYACEYRMITAEGDVVWFRDLVTVIEKQGNPNRLRGLMIDITRQKKTEQQRDNAFNRLQEHVREQKCLNRISRIDEKDLSVKELISKVVHHLPDGWRYSNFAKASIKYKGEVVESENYEETEWTLISTTDRLGEETLVLKLSYSDEIPICDEDPFLREERQLLNAVTEIMALKINRILSKKEIEKKQRLLDRAYRLAKIGSWELDLINSKLYWSHAVKKLHEVEQEYEPDLESAINFYKEGQNRTTIRKVVKNAIETGESFDEELQIITAKGNKRWVRVVGESQFEDGKCTRIFGSTQNIDKRKKAEESLKLSEHRFKSLVREGSELIAILDSEGNYKDVIPTSERSSILGMTAEKFIGENVFDYIHDDDQEHFRNILSGLRPKERAKIPPFRFRDSKNNWHWIETTISNMVDNPAICGFVTNSKDVTERINLLQTQAQFSETIENIFRFVPEGLLVFTDKMNLFKKNKAMVDLVEEYAPKLGYSEEDLMDELINQAKKNIRNNGNSEIKIPRKNPSEIE